MKYMFNNNKLPLNKAQKFQQECARKQSKKLEHDQRLELALWKEYMNGNEDAGWELFKSYKDIVAYIYQQPHKAQYKNKTNIRIEWTPAEKEDLFQEIAYQFFKLLHEYDPEMGEIIGIMKGKLHLRVYASFFEDVADQRLNEIEFDDDLGFKERVESYQNSEGDDDKKKLPNEYMELYEALGQLSKRQREVVELSILKGWNATVIGDELGISASSARTHLQKGMSRLKTLMGAD
jgi:RNA polymerase sigma factor (sigma-70 family)